jgi:LmbE family N-acetylglucosaminyl deacetylase
MTKNRLVVVTPHPARADQGVGGTIIKHVKEGWEVYVACMTLGERVFPEKESREILAEQQRSASKIEGVKEIKFLGFEDAMVKNDVETRTSLLNLIRELKPDIVVTTWYKSTHPDHRETALAVCDACLLSSLPNVPSEYPQHTVQAVYMFQVPGYSVNFEPEVYIDISDVINIKRKALEQFTIMFNLLGYSKNKIVEGVIGDDIRNGSASGVSYAECFKQYWTQHYGSRAFRVFPLPCV